MPAADDQTIGH